MKEKAISWKNKTDGNCQETKVKFSENSLCEINFLTKKVLGHHSNIIVWLKVYTEKVLK